MPTAALAAFSAKRLSLAGSVSPIATKATIVVRSFRRAISSSIGLSFRSSSHALKDTPTFASTMVYFSFGTLTTAGSADISPLYPIARSLTNVEAMIGQLYPATLLARIVTLEIEGEKA